MAKLAFLTATLTKYRRGDPRLQNFVDRFEATFAEAEVSEGFIGRPFKDGTAGEPTSPLPGFELTAWETRKIMTFSLWRDLESVFAYSYTGLHAEALRSRGEWFPTPASRLCRLVGG